MRSAAVLWDWYGNLVPTDSGDLILFVSEKSLVTVAIPVWKSDDLVLEFRLRVPNLLGLIGVHPKVIDKMEEFLIKVLLELPTINKRQKRRNA